MLRCGVDREDRVEHGESGPPSVGAVSPAGRLPPARGSVSRRGKAVGGGSGGGGAEVEVGADVGVFGDLDQVLGAEHVVFGD